MGEKVQGLRGIIGRYNSRQGEVKNIIRNGEDKELTCTTHGHELSGGMLEEEWLQGRGG